MQCDVVLKNQVSSVLLCVQATEEDGSSDEDMDDEAMMELDKSLAALFSEQKKKTQAKKDEKTKLKKERALVRDFKIKVNPPLYLAFKPSVNTLAWISIETRSRGTFVASCHQKRKNYISQHPKCVPSLSGCSRCWTSLRCSWPGRPAAHLCWVWWSLF